MNCMYVALKKIKTLGMVYITYTILHSGLKSEKSATYLRKQLPCTVSLPESLKPKFFEKISNKAALKRLAGDFSLLCNLIPYTISIYYFPFDLEYSCS